MEMNVVMGASHYSKYIPHMFGGVPIWRVSIAINARDEDTQFLSRTLTRIKHPNHDLQIAVSSGLRIRPSAISGSQAHGSGALYLFDVVVPHRGVQRAILGQYLPRGAATSCHLHRHTTETFIPICGQVQVWREHDVCVIDADSECVIDRKKQHQLVALEDSFTIIIMDGPYGLHMNDHYYCPALVCRHEAGV